MAEEKRTIPDMTALTTLSGDYNIIIHDGNGLKKTLLSKIGISDGAGAHNTWYENAYLGSSVSSDQWSEIKAGRFRGLPVGGYWTINGLNYRIGGFDLYRQCGDTANNTPHVVIVPDTNMYTAKMNDTNITTGGYQGSQMRTTNLAAAKTTIKNAFGADHILTYRGYLTNAVSNGRPSGGGWFDCDVELMNEQMVYGGSIFSPTSDGSTIPANYRIEKSQLPLFTFRPDLISNRQWFWLRDVVSASGFAIVANLGNAGYGDASRASGVRPFFLIY